MLSTLADILIGIVVVLVFSASMSTLSSLVLTSSSTLTLDVIKPVLKKDMKEKTQLRLMQVFVMCFIAISVVIAFNPPTFIAQLMGISWGALAGAFLAPFLYGLYWKGTTKAGVWCSFVFSTVVMLLNMFIRPSCPPLLQSPINAGAFCMLAGLVIVPAVSLFTKKPDKALVDGAFACYEKEVMVHQSTSLSDEDE